MSKSNKKKTKNKSENQNSSPESVRSSTKIDDTATTISKTDSNASKIDTIPKQSNSVENPLVDNLASNVFAPITKKEPEAKLNEFMLMEKFLKLTENVSPIKVIDGRLCVYQFGEYHPVNGKMELEALIYNTLKSELAQKGSRSLIKKCADLIYLELFYNPQEISCEKQGLVALRNVVIDSKTLNGYMPGPTINNTYTLDISFTSGMQSLPTPIWDKFLSCIANGNQIIINRIYEMLGYLLMPDNNAKAFFLLQGEPNSGKSVLGNFIKGYFPENKITFLDIERLGDRYSTSCLQNSCLNISMDLPNRQLPAKAISVLKQLTGGDGITLENKYHNITKYYGQCKLLFGTNHPIKLLERDNALEDRIICIPFNNPIPKFRQDNDLLKKLQAERDTIAAKAIFTYYRNLKEKNYIFAGTGEIYMKPDIIYKVQSDMKYESIRAFVKSRCDLVAFEYGKTHTKDLYDAYRVFCADTGYELLVDGKGFAQRLSKVLQGKIQKSKWRNPQTNYNGNGFEGIVLKPIYSIDDSEDSDHEDDYLPNNTNFTENNLVIDKNSPNHVKPLFSWME